MAWLPPLMKKSRTAKPRGLSTHRPPNSFSKSPKLLIVAAPFVDPRRARPMNAVIEVATAVMVRTPLGISSMYTPGEVGAIGMCCVLSEGRAESAYHQDSVANRPGGWTTP